jgi:hypothetical protein
MRDSEQRDERNEGPDALRRDLREPRAVACVTNSAMLSRTLTRMSIILKSYRERGLKVNDHRNHGPGIPL